MRIVPQINTIAMRTVSHETNDCTVRALTAAANIPYAAAHALMAKHGRKFGQGTYHETQVKAYEEAGGELRAIFGTTKGAKYRSSKAKNVPHQKGITLASLLSEMPNGRFICIMRGHAFAIINKQLADGCSIPGGSRIQAIYRFD